MNGGMDDCMNKCMNFKKEKILYGQVAQAERSLSVPYITIEPSYNRTIELSHTIVLLIKKIIYLNAYA